MKRFAIITEADARVLEPESSVELAQGGQITPLALDTLREPVYKKVDFIWHVEGTVGDGFEDNERKRHQGIDISVSLGTPINASGAGTVIYSGNTIKGYGNMVILRHSEEYFTVYAHNQVNLVEEGARIEKGQTIGKVGQTGRATGPHVHFEIRRNNKPIDPMLVI